MAADILKRIVQVKAQQVQQARAGCPMDELKARIDADRPRHSLIDALYPQCARNVNIIAEIKRASPSKGDIQPNLDVVDYVSAVAAGGAAALSVLTESSFFKGSLDDLRTARRQTDLPILRKDFIFDPYQLYEAAAAGADAILLIVRILTLSQLTELIDLAESLGLEALVEVHAESEVEPALAAGARLIGINNRNLQTFHTDLAVAKQVAAGLLDRATVVAASGIDRRAAIEGNLAVGIHNFLVGESIARANDPPVLVRRLCTAADGKDG